MNILDQIVLMENQHYCGIVEINHKKYYCIYNSIFHNFKFYYTIHNTWKEAPEEKIYSDIGFFDDVELCDILQNIDTDNEFMNLNIGDFLDGPIPYRVLKNSYPNTNTPINVLRYYPHSKNNPFNDHPYSEALTEEEYQVLSSALDKNPYLKDADKIIIRCFKNILLNQPCLCKELYDRYASIQIHHQTMPKNALLQGDYDNAYNKIIINSSLPYEQFIFSLFHELAHVHQFINTTPQSNLYIFLIEGMTEIIAFEQVQQLIPSSIASELLSTSGYWDEVIFSYILCELYDPQKLQNNINTNKSKELEDYLKTIMTEAEFYEIFGKMALYLFEMEFRKINVDDLILDPLNILYKRTSRVDPHETEKSEIIFNYIKPLLQNSIDHTIPYIKNYFVSPIEEKEITNKVLKK